MRGGGRVVALGASVVLLGGVGVGYTVLAGNSGEAAPVAAAAQLPDQGGEPQIVFLTSHGRLAAAPAAAAADAGGERAVTGVRCDRTYAAAGTVACLRPNETFTGYRLVVMDRQLHELKNLAVPGLANRLRVSADGRLVAWTVFMDGENYQSSTFSTRAGILDLTTGQVTDSLEDFAVTRDGRPYDAADLNFWGITFAADDNRFYATMATDGRRYLVKGDYAARTVETLKANVECPQLSPDGTRVVFKEAVGDDPKAGWRLSVLDLGSLEVTHLAERRSIDDQAVWVGDDAVAYTWIRPDGLHEVWTVPADGGGTATLLAADAGSPAFL